VKKNNAVVFGLTSDHVFAVACVMMDLRRLSPSVIDEVVIIHDGVSKRDQVILGSILPTRFILYDFPLKSARVLNASSVLQFSKMVFTKFECLRLLDDYKNVLWTDYDVVIKNDLSELFSYCDSGIKLMPSGMPVRGQLRKPVGEYDMGAEGIGAGLFVLQDHLKDYMKMYRFCYEQVDKYAENLYMPEQAVLDFMVQRFNLKPFSIDRRIYSPHPTDKVLAQTAKIVHAYGQPKFWNGLYNDQWQENYQAWIDMGGTKFKAKSVFVKMVVKFKSIAFRLLAKLNGV
jgi:lipopolysaccharide biosynthesis glycosyltransferase